jgi:hypothetical protein
MEREMENPLVTPCGLNCAICICYENESCKGCIGQKGSCIVVENCATYRCVADKGLRYCFECSEFPCNKLQPVADGAGTFPHNTKVFNLCRMKRVGVDTWTKEESEQIRNAYYRGKFRIGIGPVLD